MKRIVGAITGLLIVSAALLPASVGAQTDRPTVFLHGFKSEGITWQETADALSIELAIQARRPDRNWRARFDDQANELNSNPSLAGDNLLVGHSIGGLAARQWARLRAPTGIVTIGTPHQGVPLVPNLGLFANFQVQAFQAMFNAVNSLTFLGGSRGSPPFGECCDWWWLAAQVANSTGYATSLMDYGFWGALGSVGMTEWLDVLGELDPLAAFIQDWTDFL